MLRKVKDTLLFLPIYDDHFVRPPLIFMLLIYRNLGLILLMRSIQEGSESLIKIALGIFCVSNLVAFPILMESLAARVSEDYLVQAVGLIYFVSQMIMSFLPVINGKIMNSERRINTMFSFTISCGIFCIGMVNSIWADIKNYEIFGIDNRRTQDGLATDPSKSEKSKHGSGLGLPSHFY